MQEDKSESTLSVFEEGERIKDLQRSILSIKYYIPVGLWIALITFLVGSFIFGLYLYDPTQLIIQTAVLGFVFISLIHIPIVLVLAGRAVKDDRNYKRLMLVCGLMILNMPLFILYGWLATL